MYRFIAGATFGCLLSSAVGATSTPSVDLYVDQYFTQTPVETFTDFVDADGAYAFQQRINNAFKARGHKTIGYKLALTGKPRLFGAPDPLHGHLFDFMLRKNHASFSIKSFVKPLLELELAYQFKADFLPPFTTQKLASAISSVAPAIELADLVFKHPRQLSWQQVAASGTGARRLIIGEAHPFASLNLDNQQAEARWNGEPYTRGYSHNVMGSQQQALIFLAQSLHRQGQKIKAGDWVITGAMNKMLPARPGNYRVDFGSLGELEFSLTP